MKIFNVFSKGKKDLVVKKSDYVVVLHHWFVHSKGFETFVFKDLTKEQVEKEAKILLVDRIKDFNHCAYVIVEFTE